MESTPLGKKKSEYSVADLRKVALDTIMTYKTKFIIYTDGSTDGNQENGGAGVFITNADGENVLRLSAPAGKYCSSYSGECVALLHALNWICEEEQNWTQPEEILICTDSKSLTSALEIPNWRDPDHWIKEVKTSVSRCQSRVTLLWIPSHVDIPGNEVADELAKAGTSMSQEGIPVSESIVKARIKKRKWIPTHERAMETYGKRRSPIFEIEKQWPRRTRTLFSRLRSGHAIELKAHRHKIEMEDDDLCEHGCEKPETIEHVLSECVATSAARQAQWAEKVTINMMTTQPEVCRRILQCRYPTLKLNEEPPQRTPPQTPSRGVVVQI